MSTPKEYYSQNRSELLDLMPDITDATILDVGCGTGEFGKLLKDKGCGPIYGVELVEEIAAQARQVYHKVFNENIDTFTPPVPQSFFDVIVCADVLEHLKDPWDALKKFRTLLKQGGSVVSSIPNIRNGKVIGRLLRGEFGYDSEGILDRTHLRFFTFNGIIKLFADCGFRIVEIVPVYYQEAESQIPLWKQTGIPARLQEMIKIFSGLDVQLRDDELLDFFTFQFLLRAEKH